MHFYIYKKVAIRTINDHVDYHWSPDLRSCRLCEQEFTKSKSFWYTVHLLILTQGAMDNHLTQPPVVQLFSKSKVQGSKVLTETTNH